MNKIALSLTFLMLAGLAGNANAFTVYKEGSKSLKLVSFIQPRADLNFDSAPPSDDADAETGPIGPDFYLRRFRLVMVGNIHKKVQFKFNLHANNIGKVGSYKPQPYLGDAYLQYKAHKNVIINFGLLKLPFLRHMGQGAAGLHGMDFHGFILNSTAQAIGNIPHRDNGIMVRGLLAGKKIDYRVAIVDGIEYSAGSSDVAADGTVTTIGPRNSEDMPRMVGRIAYNLFDATPEYHWAGTYLGKKKIVTFGLSWDMQPGIAGDEGKDMYSAFGADIFVDLPMGKNGLVFTANGAQFGEGGPMAGDKGGMGLWADLGYRIGKIEPLVAFEQYIPDNEADDDHKGEHQAILVGLNYWAMGHGFNIKVEYGMVKKGIGVGEGEEAEGKFNKYLNLQSQVKF